MRASFGQNNEKKADLTIVTKRQILLTQGWTQSVGVLTLKPEPWPNPPRRRHDTTACDTQTRTTRAAQRTPHTPSDTSSVLSIR